MRTTEQAQGLTVYEHGMDVANRYNDLYCSMKTYGPPCYKWDIPQATRDQLKAIQAKALPPSEAHSYQLFHDCGKPLCLTHDEQGRRHFPDHARVSAAIWRNLFPEDEQTARLIEKDMLCHTVRGEAIDELVKDPDAPTLLLTAWAELHSNAEKLFGGFTSDSFKIKRKQLTKLTNRLTQEMQHATV